MKYFNSIFSKKSKTVTILSIDGGGVRGIIPAIVLKEIQNRLALHGKDRPVAETFDIIAGTSTGSLIALGCALPQEIPGKPGHYNRKPKYTISEITDLYKECCCEIFQRSTFNQLRSIVQYLDIKYDADILEQFLFNWFGNATMQDALTNVLVPCYDINKREPVFFTKIKITEKPIHNFYMRDLVRAATSAPTFFEPCVINSISGGRTHQLIDGGVFCHNPALSAYIEARKLYPYAKKFIIVSLGTGTYKTGFEIEKVKHWGLMKWLSPWNNIPLMSIMRTGQNDSVCHQLKKIPDVLFFRFNVLIDACDYTTDDASDRHMNCLVKKAEEIIYKNNRKLNFLCTYL